LQDQFRDFLDDRVVLFDPEMPECEAEDVLVEYYSNVHKFIVYENLLIATGKADSRPAAQSSFCVESTHNSEVETLDEAHSQLKGQSKFIAKICRDKSVCDDMPCIRKCCREGQRMAYTNRTTCESHDQHLAVNFHDFKLHSAPEQPNPMEPNEFGIMQPKSCVRYKLDKEEDGDWFFSGIDGALFVPKFKQHYSKEGYCVDYFYRKDNQKPSNLQVNH